MAEEVRAGERAASRAVRAETDALKTELRGQVTGTLGGKARGIANAWRSQVFPRIPGAVTAPAALGITGGMRLSGGFPSDVVRLQVFEATSNSLAAAVKLATEPTALPWDRTGLTAGQARWYWLRVVSAEGNVSALAGPVTATAL
nr:DUF6441 family protein [Neoroseomonas eburnea]